MKESKYGRLLNGEKKPSERSILATIGTRGTKLWKQLRAFLKVNYDFKPELHFYGRKYGWCYKYTRKNKTLCVLFPETKAFSVLVVLGKKDVAQFEEDFSKYNENTQQLFKTAYQYHDGKWLYKRVLNKSDLTDVLKLIKIKRGRKEKGSIS
ncbi:hypothetical protein AMJ87_00015 [candidate division WOR_3 bacterium SM23_60]|uniref:DUF3788 domain-containing protein n=1 Tax=candidate division WOR_3 bacterium SM23_60 TaxID=1703780 RepID=A0A0S8GM34_UNCW3|nr:MAG: hypothetical protein AMJ87_00015 [candidate division WOR_3 bacterium SM23_60]